MTRSSSSVVHEDLYRAVRKGSLCDIQVLVDQGADIHAYFDYYRKGGGTVMHVAAFYGHQHLLAFFESKGLDVNATDNDRNTPLHLSSEYGDVEVVKFLLDQHANMHAVNVYDQKPIQFAAYGGHTDVVKYFLDLGISVDETDEYGRTALHHAAKGGHLQLVQFLVDRIDAKPQLDAQNNKGETPMHLCYYGKHNILNCLLDAGARSNIKDHDGRTVLFYFMRSHDYYDDRVQSIWKKMHHNFVDIDDWTKMTAAHLIVPFFHHKDLIQFVLQHQKDLNLEDKYGETPLNYFTRRLLSLSSTAREETLIRMFVDHGAYFKADDYEGIVRNRSLKKKLFTDKKFCSQCLVNKFDNVDLPMLGRLPSAMSPTVLEKLKLKSSQICQIERAVEEEIRNKGHCDVSKMVPPLLSMLAIESYVSHYHAS